MEQIAWAAIGLLAAGFFATFGMFLHLSVKIDSGLNSLSQRMDAGLASVSQRMDARFDRADARFDAMNARIDSLATQLQVHIERHAS